jgi:hypothetical protein
LLHICKCLDSLTRFGYIPVQCNRSGMQASPSRMRLNRKTGFRQVFMTGHRSRKIVTRLRIALCLVVLALVQPQVVLCVGSNGNVVVEFNSFCCAIPLSSPASSDACIANSDGDPSETCSDTPIWLISLNGKSPATETVLNVQRTQCLAVEGPSSDLSPYESHFYSPHLCPGVQCLSAIQSTVLLI